MYTHTYGHKHTGSHTHTLLHHEEESETRARDPAASYSPLTCPRRVQARRSPSQCGPAPTDRHFKALRGTAHGTLTVHTSVPGRHPFLHLQRGLSRVLVHTLHCHKNAGRDPPLLCTRRYLKAGSLLLFPPQTSAVSTAK